MLTDIQLLSDLHLKVERGDQPLYTLDFPCLCSQPRSARRYWMDEGLLKDYLRLGLQLTRFECIFFVSGHHEPYVGTLVSGHSGSGSE